ncbi:uncharacterized protein K444DRAFT_541349 [Hyaloscypha bicolor E]|uniref:Ubiquitin-like domain-containing protein n=1 Tax=Hyaloscypha bicolor E TaxID=1095630 RepID=A0A2J6SRP1_9HELO|nr:uncharacterized protein K444DRAFT_541349 [Hyaloscypha bicolor E]PMD53455.1 hypothetical protein K444DRAFT_541349 [Hyaloscypha bicolor E]
MSFDFSIGDFLAGVTLIKDIISALRGTAKLEYRELELELHGLQRALDELEHLQPGPGQEVAVNSVKAAALMCRYPLEEFQAELKRYQLLLKHKHHKKRDVVDGCVRKVQWNLSMPDEVQKLRAYIAAHVGSLNMRLLTVGLTTMTVAQTEASERDGLIRNELTSQMIIISENTAKVGTLYTLVARQIVPSLQSLVGLAEKVWSTNLQILAFFSSLQNNQTQIDIRHTWFQEPLRLDDAFGRTIPIPVEYGWSKLEAIIHNQFCRGPGNKKVFAGEYEIFKTDDSSQLITQRNFSLLRPGTAITMAMVIGRYEGGLKDQCPKPDCKSKMFTKSNAGGLM